MEDKNQKDVHPIDPKTFYILLKNRTAEKQVKGYSSNSFKKCISLLKGTILFRNRDTAVPDKSSGLKRFHLYEKPSYFCDCPAEEVDVIDEEEARLYLTFISIDERFKFYEDNSLKNGKNMTIGTSVYVKVRSQGAGRQEIRGVIKYKGPLPNEDGTMFGVELEGRGRGTTDGNFRGKRYFKCDTDCGLFVSIEKLRLCEDASKTKSDNKSDTKEVKQSEEDNSGMITKFRNKLAESWSNLMSGEQTHEENSLEKLDKMRAGHKIDDRVWVYIYDKLHGGFIRYIGRTPGGKQILAGIELDNPVGQGHGEYDGKQLFSCAMNHAHFTRIENVIPNAKLGELYDGHSRMDSNSTSKDNPPSAPQTSEDIVKMESDFSKKSTDQVIKEQERLLEKIKKEEKQKIAEKKQSKAGIGTSLDEHCKSKNENQSKPNHVSRVNIQVNSHHRDPRSPTSMNYPRMASIPPQSKMDVGSMVEVLSKNQNPRYGVIRWLGFLPSSDKKIAGLELEQEMDACTDGTFLGQRLFTCPSRRGFFVHLHNCMPDSRFNRNSIENPASKRSTGGEFGPYHSKIIEHGFIPPPETLDAYLKEGPQGIQGHHNSCYLDATLFAAFSFSTVMDSILLRPRNDKDIKEYEKVQAVLRNNIVYPLRDSGFVRADRVLELRQLLDRLGTVEGLVGEEKDPEEFLLTLLQQVLKSEPFLKIKSGRVVRNEYFYQVLADKDVERVLPSVEELLKKSFHQSELKLTEVPSCLIVQMPRFGKGFKMYDRILPSLTINIGELVDNSPQDCVVCGRLALYHCRDCFSVTGSEDKDSSGNFCKECHERFHSHTKRAKHKVQPIAVSREICSSYSNKPVEHREMELFAVICIETSHYVSFVKCEEPSGEVKWCFFDSMADRIGTKKGYNVPSVTECPEIIEWLSSEKQNRERIINTSDKEMPDKVRRLLGDAYVCLYESKEMAMYK